MINKMSVIQLMYRYSIALYYKFTISLRFHKPYILRRWYQSPRNWYQRDYCSDLHFSIIQLCKKILNQMQHEIIKTQNLSKGFNNGLVVTTVIRALDLSIYQGEFTIIMGNSGSGKSTLLYLLCGLDKADSGEITIDNNLVHNRSEKELALLRRNNIGFVFQDNNLVPNLTIKENVLIAGY